MQEPKVTVLERELATYERQKAELLTHARDQFVLIKGDEVMGTFFDRADALKRGYEHFGNEPFLVKQVVEVEPPINFASFNVAL